MPQIVSPARSTARRGRVILAALAALLLAGSLSAPSFAADRGRHDRRPARHYHHPPSRPAYGYGYGGPGYIQAPPPVVYAPPVYTTPFSLGLNFNIR
jgi:hypothetical protein